jgi:hypothetical protein
MRWNVIHSAVDDVLDVELIVEQESVSGLWCFSVGREGAEAVEYRSDAEWDTPENARRVAETWYALSDFKMQRTVEMELSALVWVADHMSYLITDISSSPFLAKLIHQGDVKEHKLPDGHSGYESTGQGIVRLGQDQCPYCRKQLYGQKEHAWCVREHEAKARR